MSALTITLTLTLKDTEITLLTLTLNLKGRKLHYALTCLYDHVILCAVKKTNSADLSCIYIYKLVSIIGVGKQHRIVIPQSAGIGLCMFKRYGQGQKIPYELRNCGHFCAFVVQGH